MNPLSPQTLNRPISTVGVVIGSLGVALAAALLFSVPPPLEIAFLTTGGLLILPFVHWVMGRRVDLFEPVWLFAVMYSIGYGYKAALILFDPAFVTFPDFFPNPDEINDVIEYSALLSLLGLGAFYMGYFGGLHESCVRLIPKLRGEPSSNEGRLVKGALIGIALSLGALGLLARIGGTSLSPALLFSSEARVALLNALFGHGLIALAVFLMPLFALAYLYYVLTLRPPLGGVIFATVFFVTCLSMALMGGRIQLLGFVVGSAALWHFTRRALSLKLQLTGMAAVAATGAVLGVLLIPDEYSATSLVDLARRLAGTFDSLDHLVLAQVQSYDMRWGSTVTEDLVLTYLPRALFEGKPVIYGITSIQELLLPGIGQLVSFSATFPPSILGEGYVNFGFAGVLLFPFATGVVLRTVYEKGVAERGPALIILALTVGQMLGALRGLGPFLVNTIVLYAVVWLFFKARLPLPGQHRDR